MAKDNLQEFYRELSKNQEWQEKLKGASDVETFTRLVAESSKEKGYSFTNEQVKVATTEALENEAASTDVWEELPDEQLVAVAAGLGDYLWAGNPDGGAPDGGTPDGGTSDPKPLPPLCFTGMKQTTQGCK